MCESSVTLVEAYAHLKPQPHSHSPTAQVKKKVTDYIASNSADAASALATFDAAAVIE